MAGIEEIDVHIDRHGRVRIEVRGVTGQKCEALTFDLEQMLGGNVSSREYQDAYYQNEQDVSQAEQVEEQS